MQLQLEKEVAMCERNNPAYTKVDKGGAPGTTAEIPLYPMEVNSGASIQVQLMKELTPEQVDAQRRLWTHEKPVLEQVPGRTYDPVRRWSHAGAGLLAALMTLWELTLDQSVSEGLHPVERAYTGVVSEEL